VLTVIALAAAAALSAPPRTASRAVAAAHARIVRAARISFSSPAKGSAKAKRGLVEFE